MDPRFRVAEESDAPLLLQFMQQYYAFDGHPFDEPKARTALLNFLRDPTFGRAWLIYDQQTPVGYIVLILGYSLELLGRDAFIDEFFLAETHRSRGWGRKTMEFVEEYARSLGIRAIHLEVVRSNHRALEVYRKLGFHGREHHLMTKRIAPEPPKSGS
ncbi:MAG: GNAT family N-acetyltransferase [Terriglobales bacterium]